MSRAPKSLNPAYFTALYAADPDPWRFASSAYEREKYAATLVALPRRRFASAFEIGCSIGVLTAALAPRCTSLLSIDVAEAALVQARHRCAAFDHVRFDAMQVPGAWPAGAFDLILASEVLYYLDRHDLSALALRVAAALTVDGVLMLVHWVRETDYPLSGDEAVTHLLDALGNGFRVLDRARTDDYRLDVLARVP